MKTTLRSATGVEIAGVSPEHIGRNSCCLDDFKCVLIVFMVLVYLTKTKTARMRISSEYMRITSGHGNHLSVPRAETALRSSITAGLLSPSRVHRSIEHCSMSEMRTKLISERV